MMVRCAGAERPLATGRSGACQGQMERGSRAERALRAVQASLKETNEQLSSYAARNVKLEMQLAEATKPVLDEDSAKVLQKACEMAQMEYETLHGMVVASMDRVRRCHLASQLRCSVIARLASSSLSGRRASFD
jgi:uncharacterized protein YigA (DUF484 family)